MSDSIKVLDEWTIYWTEIAETYLYGSSIRLDEDERVDFDNSLLPPGTIIKTWNSKTSYQAHRMEPDLPILDADSKYVLKSNIETEGKGKCLIHLVFYNQLGDKISDLFFREKEEDFFCPQETYSYQMELVNGGITRLIYDSITIQEVVDESKQETSKRV